MGGFLYGKYFRKVLYPEYYKSIIEADKERGLLSLTRKEVMKMLRGYYRDFRLAEKLGEQFVRDLFHCILSDIEQEKDVGKTDLLIGDIETLRTFPGSNKLAEIYQELSEELSSWLSKNCEFNEDNQFIGFKA